MENMSIAQLVSKAASGDNFAWTDLYTLTFQEAYFTAKKIVKNEDDAVELVHDAYTTAFQKLGQLEEKEKFQSWFNVTVANKCRDYLRKKKPLLFSEMETEDGNMPEWEDESDYGQPEASFDKKETVYLIAEIVDSLPEDQKLCTILHYRDQQSVAQIAEALEISEGTVKSRLNYARKKVKIKVEELERQGVKLCGLAPIPLLVWLLKTEAEAVEIPAIATAAPAITTTAAATTAATGTAVAAQTVAAGVGVKAALSSVVGKVIAGVLAVSVAVGGVAVYSSSNDRNNAPDGADDGTQIVQPTPVDPADEAYALYEDMLRTGSTESGLKIAYYAYLDLDHDDVPELLISDADGTPDSWSACEVYTYRDDSLHCCGTSGVHYDYFYLVNDEYVLGQSRMGHQFISTSEFIATTIYHWDEAKTRNDPAISYNGGDWEYITREEFDSYHTMPAEGEIGTGFIKAAEIITLQENTFFKEPVVQGIVVDLHWFAFHLPEDWIGRFELDIKNNWISLYEKNNYEDGNGLLVSIVPFMHGEDYSYLPNYTYLGTFSPDGVTAAQDFIAYFPSDVQFTEETAEEYMDMYADIPEILEKIEWHWLPVTE